MKLLKNKNEDKKISKEFVERAYKVYLRRLPSDDEIVTRVNSGIKKSELLKELWGSEELESIIEAPEENIKVVVSEAEIDKAYKIFLDRFSSNEEINHRITSGISIPELLEELWDSEEFNDIYKKKTEPKISVEDVNKAYRYFLNRTPSQSELTNRIASEISKEVLLKELWDSEEFKHIRENKAEASIDAGDVYKAYNAFFRRLPTVEEVSNRIKAGISKQSFLEELFQSDELLDVLETEFKKTPASKDEIIKAYEVFFRRSPSETELSDRVKSGVSKQGLLEELFKSDELLDVLRIEFKKNPASGDEIQKAYEVFFRRSPSETELFDRVKSGISKQDLLQELWDSEELNQKMHKVSLESSNDLERKDIDENTKLILKKILIKRWELADSLDRIKKIAKLHCNICGYEGSKNDYEILSAECAFGGGVLERYRCPKCGVIFGPLKMLELTSEELEDEYKSHYSIYNEGNCTDKELMTFYSLNPNKNERYLNFGCGIWADTIEVLRGKGFDIWGYEPFATEIKNPYVINDFNVLKTMRFDGIFSNDLLEHVTNPIEYFEIFRSLLKGGSSRMAHSTGCYKYLYETNRFHLYFYTGASIDLLCKKTGFEVDNYQEDSNIEYFNYIYKVKER